MRFRNLPLVSAVLTAWLAVPSAVPATPLSESFAVDSFETSPPVARYTSSKATITVVKQGVGITDGRRALGIEFGPHEEANVTITPVKPWDWAGTATSTLRST